MKQVKKLDEKAILSRLSNGALSNILGGRPIPCVFDNVQYSLQSFIIENAQKRHLIK